MSTDGLNSEVGRYMNNFVTMQLNSQEFQRVFGNGFDFPINSTFMMEVNGVKFEMYPSTLRSKLGYSRSHKYTYEIDFTIVPYKSQEEQDAENAVAKAKNALYLAEQKLKEVRGEMEEESDHE